jgi:rhodanese-related sulfurtransferase
MVKRLYFGMFLLLAMGIAAPALAADIRMSKEDLKALLGKPQAVIVDVRIAKDWNAGDSKIPGAVRERPEQFGAWADKYPKEKTLVLYCA